MATGLKKQILSFEKELSLKNQAIESSISAIALTDIEGNIVYINTSFIKMFGFDNKNIFLRRNAASFWDKQVEATERMENIHEKGSWSGELTVRKKDGSHLITLASANIIRDNLDEEIAIMISFIDVSKQKELEDDFQTIFNSVNDGIIIYSLEGQFLEANQITCDNLGYPKDELMQMTVMEITPPEIRKTIGEQIVEKMYQGGGIVETISRCKDGSLVPVELNIRPIKYKGINAILAVARDISERKKAEADLKMSEEKYFTLVENGNDGIIVVQDDLLKFANQKFIDICGFSKDEIIGKSFFDLISTEYKKIVQERYNKRFSSENVPNNYEIEILSKDGNFIPVEIIGSIITYEGKSGDMIIIRDITERKHMGEALQKSEQKFRTIFNNTNDSIIIYDLDGSIIEVNEVACQFTGYSRDEMLSMSVMDLDSPEQAAKIPDHIKCLQKGKRAILESVAICKDGTPVPIELSNRLIEYEGKTAVLSIARDITERKKQNIK